IGVDQQIPRDALWALVDASANAGCRVFLVHARMAWLKGLSPRQNRDIPPLDYPLVYQLKESFPELQIIVNGGINTLQECHTHLEHVDGVMVGREAYSNPYLLSRVDREFYASSKPPPSRKEVMEKYMAYAETQLANGSRLNQLSKHIVGLYHGEPRSRLWRRHISENAHLAGSDTGVLADAYLAMVNV
ncbi:MAG: tRNA dihydrouridine(20/20a) synthase DusA, partial [Gammaproteobacteria bacterium]|nr:tRNA dihydrouridine(20/20a) synthase DusA [Gammaproteobacteria bacterium]